MVCRQCPRYCAIDRSKGEKGFCGGGKLPKVAMYDLHYWEEPCISGDSGSGTVFFSLCNLRCIYCQNHTISQRDCGQEKTPDELADIFLELEARGAHNVNLVSPSHYAWPIGEAMALARKRGLKIPFVYNSNGYDSHESLERLSGLVDIYLPDLKYFSDELASQYSSVPGYFAVAAKAVLEMSRQVGPVELDEKGIVKRGLIVRHLVLPGAVEDTVRVLHWIADNLPRGTYVSLMAQYYPTHKAVSHPVLGRKLSRSEYEKAVDALYSLGLEDGYVQELDSASADYTPDFERGQIRRDL